MSDAVEGTFRFGVSQFSTKPWSFEEDVARYTALGVDAIEVVEDKLDRDRYVEQMLSIAAAGLTISGIQPSVRTIFDSRMCPEPQAPKERIASLRRSIEMLGPHALGVPFMVNTGAHPRGDMAEAMAATADALQELSTIAADHGVSLALEPLNPSSINVESVIWTVGQALEILDRVDRHNVGLCLDLWNIWQNADVEASIMEAADKIFTVQVADWHTPRSFADRLAPGDGVLPLGKLLSAVKRAGVDLPIVLELFSNDVPHSLFEEDLATLIMRSRHNLEHEWYH